MGWLGIDDTDHLGGGCTTKTVHDLLLRLPAWVHIEQIRLVRLWPFAPGRTRGNAAVAVKLQCEDEHALLQHLENEWVDHLQPLSGGLAPSHHSDRHQHPADPGMVWFKSPPHVSFYRKAVSQLVTLESVPKADRSWGGAGRIGATAAVAWTEERVTYEVIAWRVAEAEGVRRVDFDALRTVDDMDGTFLSRDPRNGTSLVAPRGPSPVLFGVRATFQHVAERAAVMLTDAEQTESVEAWRCFATNQASGDHLSGSLTGCVVNTDVHPKRKHARILTDAGPVIAYSESGDVNRLARWLVPGDVIEAKGLKDDSGCLHVELLRLHAAAPRGRSRPPCPACGKTMKSMGQQQGLRCPGCKHRAPKAWVDVDATPPYTDWVEPPANARRHLARPLRFDNQ